MDSPRAERDTPLRRRSRSAGFTVAELLVTLMITGAVVAGVGTVFTTQNHVYVQQEQHLMLEENLRTAMSMVTDSVRLAGCGVPTTLLHEWIPWTSGFTTEPIVIQDGGGGPDAISIAACSPVVASLSSEAAVNGNLIVAATAFPGHGLNELFNANDKRLIWIGDTQHALVRGVSGSALTIDTDPVQTGNQGMLRLARVGTPISRIDVSTFAIETDPGSGRSWLSLDQHRGITQPIAEGVTDLQIQTVSAGLHYRVTLSARSERPDPLSGTPISRSLTAEVMVRN